MTSTTSATPPTVATETGDGNGPGDVVDRPDEDEDDVPIPAPRNGIVEFEIAANDNNSPQSGPNTFPMYPGATKRTVRIDWNVLGANGKLNRGCSVSWKVYKAGTEDVVATGNQACSAYSGIYQPIGSYEVRADAYDKTSDTRASDTWQFAVVPQGA
jgi:hypothetical protein